MYCPYTKQATRLASTHPTTPPEENRIHGTPEIACPHPTPSLPCVRAGQRMSASCIPSSSGSSLPCETSQGAAGVPTCLLLVMAVPRHLFGDHEQLIAVVAIRQEQQ